jgi:hypothetical protein
MAANIVNCAAGWQAPLITVHSSIAQSENATMLLPASYSQIAVVLRRLPKTTHHLSTTACDVRLHYWLAPLAATAQQ